MSYRTWSTIPMGDLLLFVEMVSILYILLLHGETDHLVPLWSLFGRLMENMLWEKVHRRSKFSVKIFRFMFILIIGLFTFFFIALVVKDINVIFFLENEFPDPFGYAHAYGCTLLGAEEHSYRLEIIIILLTPSALKNSMAPGCFTTASWICTARIVNSMRSISCMWSWSFIENNHMGPTWFKNME